MNRPHASPPSYRRREPLGQHDIDELVRRQRPGFTLEQPFYTDPGIFERDIERVFWRRWQFVGHTSRIPEAGDYFLYPLAGESFIVIRQPDGSVQALLNVCRHRGSRLLPGPEGHVKKLVCPYHAWTYDHDGRLLACPSMPDDFEKSSYGLERYAVHVAHGLIFVCLDADPPDLRPVLDAVAPFLDRYDLGEARTCHRSTHTVGANWKLVAENFWECYHCPHAHPEFCSVMSYGRAMNSPRLAEEQARFVAEWEARNLGGRAGHVTLPGWGLECHRLPIRPDYVTQSQDGRPVAPLLGRQREYDGGVVGIMMYPLIWFVVCNDHAMLSRFTPIGPLVTEAEFTWLVRPDAVEGRDYEAARVSWLWTVTGAQDWKICEDNQAGVGCRGYRPGPYSLKESAASGFDAWYLGQVAADADVTEER